MISLDPHIFRAYDIRGKVPAQINEDVYRVIGRGFGSIVRELYAIEHPLLAVGRDMRTHSPGLEKALIEGLVETGCDVIEIGMTPSPVNYFVICNRKLDGGLQVTASHNPKEDNGIKLQIRDAVAFAGDDIQTLLRRIQAGTFLTGKGSVKEMDGITPYLDWLEKQFGRCAEGAKVVIDTGNGTSGPVMMEALRRIGASVTGLYLDPDGTFPNHPADPSKRETLKELQANVVAEKADIGFALDGDGDRLGVVDEKGMILSCDQTLLFLAEDYLKRFPGKPVVFTTSMSSTLETEIRTWGGKPVMCKVGHSFVEHEMQKHGAPLGGEQSGHFFLEDLAHGYDDALIVALQVLRILRCGKEPLSQRLAHYPKVFVAQELRPACPDDRKFQIVESITGFFQKHYPVNTMDGARIDFGGGAWSNIRASNTSPKISVCMEARSPEKLTEIESLILSHLQSYPEIALNE
ncbi:MAG: phosphomannomutase/phosphoglucomutase [Candidatus Peribacteraceae bacterium]|nr:phosphomannomutase/phosphoglucomutase [Candidatus Peribacteraceae bacterium]MDD5742134.1 phosphomannomutase/phosphoglucomutase [Candidatus Peribacteraceae bacterium]